MSLGDYLRSNFVFPRRVATVIDLLGPIWSGTSDNTSNAYTLTLDPAITRLVDGQSFRFKSNHTNTGAATMNVNGLGAKSIKRINGSTALSASDITSGNICEIVWDEAGDAFRLIQLA